MAEDFQVIEGTVKIKGQGGAKITSTTDGSKERLDVAATITTVGFDGMVLALLTDPVGGGTDFAVDGSSPAVVFEYTGDATDSVEVSSLSLILEDNGFKVGNSFMNIASALSNGVLVEIKAQDIALPPINLQRTRDLIEFSTPGNPFLFSGANSLLRTLRTAESGIILAPQGTFGTDDFVRITVRDNLSSLSFAHARFSGRKL